MSEARGSTGVIGEPEQQRQSGSSSAAIVEVKELEVAALSGHAIIEDLDIDLRPGEILGVVGESGSGKTTAALALLGYTSAGAKITRGQVQISGREMELSQEQTARGLRGSLVSYVPQNPGTALNPSMRIGDAIGEMIRAHKSNGDSSIPTALETVGLPPTTAFQRRYPHQLSGGQQQRVCISVALVCEPPVVVLDEPTTGLDVVTQSRILEELLRLRREKNIAMVYITHDLAVVAQIASRIAVMYAGRIVEQGPAEQVLREPRHPYTRGLLTSIPDHVQPSMLEPMEGVAVGISERPTGCSFAPRCPLRIDACDRAVPPLRSVAPRHDARCLRAEDVAPPSRKGLELTSHTTAASDAVLTVTNLRAEYRSGRETVVAADDVSFLVGKGRCTALVGESGSGKTTIARSIAGLHGVADGEVRLGDEVLPALARKRSREQRRKIQLIFQNPVDAVNPKLSIRDTIARPARLLRGLSRREANAEVDRMLDLVRLPRSLASSYPMELSGGESQRVGIARALIAEPEIVVCDEITSALDVSVQAAVLDLLEDLRTELGLGLLFITHDLGVVATVADDVLVLENGRVCESGTVDDILERPQQEYTKRLLESAPSVSHALALWEGAGDKSNASA